MNDAELYRNSNILQKRDALQCLEEYGKKIKWKKGGVTVIDIGCGDGSVTTSVLKNFVPNNCNRLIGCDISENMVQFANEHHASEHTSFMVLDIEGDLPKELRRNFDHAFSFYALHWIKHQEQAFTNIYDLLAKEGDCFLMFPGHMPIFDVYRTLALSTRWSFWLKDIDRFISPYHDCQDPEKEVKRMMTSIGFTAVDVKCLEKSFIYTSLETVKKAVLAINPFKIPKDLQEDFLGDYVNILRDMQMIDHVNNNIDGEVNVKFNYNVIIAYGKK
ncbi:unnamed protein product [Euphydryas editha]|uniref:Methyltransferase type 12 domain-containing protein n=1 Tax=Euphydryas editha TaxID=104508 RepID=A0AAU9V8U1_EUPED|nr:unnamed protein product [Euphydryas editha]